MEKQVPYNIEAEFGVLGSLIIDPQAIDEVIDILSAQDFYRDANRMIYSVIVSLASKRIPSDFLTISDELERLGQMDEIGGPGYITELANQVPTSGNVRWYAEIVARSALNRRLIHAGSQIVTLAYSEADNAVEQADKLLYSVSAEHASQDFSSVGAIADDVLSDLMALHDGQKTLVGVPTGFKEIDHCLGGMQPSDLLILAARPAMGKSSLSLSIAYNAVFTYGQRVALFSLEMSKKQLVQRLLSYDTHVPLYCLRNGYVQDDQWADLMVSQERLNTDKLMIDDTGGITLSALRSKARRLKASHGLDLIIVDYLQLMHADAGNRNRNREQEVAELSTGLKELAKELDIPVLALAQLSRAVEGRKEKVPMLSDLRESGSIENDADVVMFIYRDEYYNPETQRQGLADIIIAKHRNGPVGEVELRFIGSETRFENLEVSA
jgi:replicative DNA helicase